MTGHDMHALAADFREAKSHGDVGKHSSSRTGVVPLYSPNHRDREENDE